MLLRRHYKNKVKEEVKEEVNIEYEDITKSKIIDLLNEKGIEHNPRDKKETLYNLLGSE